MLIRPRHFLLALALGLAVAGLALRGTAGQAISNGDEAIYAQAGREMADGGNPLDITWQGEPQFPRPPMAVWATAIGHALAGHDEDAVRWPLAIAAALEVILIAGLGAALGDVRVGLGAAALLGSTDLFIGYARFYESEPFLCVFVIAAFACYAAARRAAAAPEPSSRRPHGWMIGWGMALGGALLTKQMVGALPLLAPLLDATLGRRGRLLPEARVPRRALLGGLAAAVVVAAPWHLQALWRHGDAFVDAFFVQSVWQRSTGVMLHRTGPSFYLRELWRSEGPFAVAYGAATLMVLVSAIRRRSFGAALLASWILVVLGVYSTSRSRYDHYALLAYPALALALAYAIVAVVPARRGRVPVAPLFLCGLALAQGARVALRHGTYSGENEVRQLMRTSNAMVPRPTRVLTYNTHPYAARYYSDVDVTLLLESPDDFQEAERLRRTGMPIPAELAPDLAAALADRRAPWVLLLPRKRANLVMGQTRLAPIAATPHYLLISPRW